MAAGARQGRGGVRGAEGAGRYHRREGSRGGEAVTADSRAPRSAWRFAFLFGARHAKAFQNAYRSVFLSGVSVLGRTSVIAAFMAIPGAMLPCVAHAYHEGPTHAEVLGLDRKQHRIYFAQFDESEVAHAPVLSYFELRGTRPSFVIRVPGPLYLGDDPDGEMDRQIEELRLRLERPHALDSTKFTVRVRPTQLADSIFAVGTVDTVS